MMERPVKPDARSVPMWACWAATIRPSSTYVAKAAAARKRTGNITDSSAKPATSSWSAAFEGCSAIVKTSAAPACLDGGLELVHGPGRGVIGQPEQGLAPQGVGRQTLHEAARARR